MSVKKHCKSICEIVVNKNIQVKFEDDIIEMIEIEDYVQTMKEGDADPAKQYKDIKLNL